MPLGLCSHKPVQYILYPVGLCILTQRRPFLALKFVHVHVVLYRNHRCVSSYLLNEWVFFFFFYDLPILWLQIHLFNFTIRNIFRRSPLSTENILKHEVIFAIIGLCLDWDLNRFFRNHGVDSNLFQNRKQ